MGAMKIAEVTRRRGVLVAVVTGCCLTLGLTPAASAASKGGACAVRDANVFVRTSSGIVFAKTKRIDGQPVRRIYACLFRTDRIVSLSSRRKSNSVSTGPRVDPQLSGRYVGYVQNFGEETRTGAVGINVVDLKLGMRVAGFRYPLTGGWDVESLVVKRSGGIAWTGDEPPIGEGHEHVNKIDGPQPSGLPANENKVLLDPGPGVDTRSLALSSDRRSVSWVRYDGVQAMPMSAPLG